ncbi:MAG: copper homeostasis periplasmic binding protein CopC [Caulobacteraceae bacterium]
MSHRIAAVAALATLAVIGPKAARAHARLMSADPPAGASVKHPPRILRASFSEALVGPFSGLELATDKGAPVAIGKTTLDPKNPRTLIAPIVRPLAAGGYVVKWRAVSVDTHRMTGRYGFRVEP